MPGPSPESGGYQSREVPPVTAEQAPRQSFEVMPSAGERAETHEQAMPAQPAPPVPAATTIALPAPVQTTSNQVSSASIGHSTPVTASDDGLIEREWVDKAKKIVQLNKSDPYTQEHEVSKLQADYIKKRYGKDVRLPSQM